jgi:hypothetical protein
MLASSARRINVDDVIDNNKTNVPRTKLQLKKLNIRRMYIYNAVHAEATLRWDNVEKCIKNFNT